jgi:predicted ATPase
MDVGSANWLRLPTWHQLQERPGLSVEDSIVDFVGTKRMLIVLDNCEQALEAVGRVADKILRHCPEVRLLATSRQDLEIEGEQVWRLEPLDVASTTAGFETIAASEGVRLFTERAVAAQNAFVLNPSNAVDVTEICARLDGIPLAIELAAARISSMSPKEMAGLLDERFRLLTTGSRTAEERHQTLRGVIDWSYSLLSSEEQACFARLGVFVGTFDTDAVTEVTEVSTDPWTVRDIMASLVAKSMVTHEIDDTTATTRYTLFESLRHYALDRLGTDGELEGSRLRHAQYFTDLAERAGPELLGPQELCWRAKVRADRDNLRAAVSWSLKGGDDGERAVQIAAALSAYALFEAAGDLSSLVELVVDRAESAPPALRAAVLGSAAFAAFQNHGDICLAERLATAALLHGVPAGCPAPAHAFGTMLLVLTWAGRGDEARALSAEAIATVDRIKAADFHRAMVRQGAAASAALRGDTEQAQAVAAAGLELARRIAMPSGLSAALWTASLSLVSDRPQRALLLAEEAVEVIRAGASDAIVGHVLAIRAQLRSSNGEVAEALADLREAIEVSQGKGDLAALMVGFDRGLTVLGAAGQSEAVAFLAGVCLEGPLSVISTLPRVELDERSAVIARARANLGANDFDAAFARGASLPPDEVPSYVLGVLQALGS